MKVIRLMTWNRTVYVGQEQFHHFLLSLQFPECILATLSTYTHLSLTHSLTRPLIVLILQTMNSTDAAVPAAAAATNVKLLIIFLLQVEADFVVGRSVDKWSSAVCPTRISRFIWYRIWQPCRLRRRLPQQQQQLLAVARWRSSRHSPLAQPISSDSAKHLAVDRLL